MKCPKCGHEQVGTVECESCGIIFAKYRQLQETQQEMPALRTSTTPSKRPPYMIIGIAAGVVLLLVILVLSAGEEAAPVKPVATKAKAEEVAAAPAEDEVKYRNYKKLTGYNMDRTFLRFHPDITQEYLEEFNYNWIRAYNCEYSTEIKDDKSRFYEIMRKTMDEELRYRYDFPVKYQSTSDLRMKLLVKDRDEVELKRYISIRTNLNGTSKRFEPGCNDVRNMNTSHSIRFTPFRDKLRIDVPQKIFAALDYPERGFELEVDLKFRIEGSTYEYLRSQESFRIRHTAIVEEMRLLNNDNASREDRVFMTLRESELY